MATEVEHIISVFLLNVWWVNKQRSKPIYREEADKSPLILVVKRGPQFVRKHISDLDILFVDMCSMLCQLEDLID